MYINKPNRGIVVSKGVEKEKLEMKTKGEIMENKGRDNSGKTMKTGLGDRSEITNCMLKNEQ